MNRAQYLKQYHKEFKNILKLREKGLTFAQIAEHYGVSRQAAQKRHKKAVEWQQKQEVE